MVARGIVSQLMGSEFRFGKMKKLEVHDGDGWTTVRMYLMPQNWVI